MREKGLAAGGFLFSTDKDYKEAKEELESVNFLRSKTDITNPRAALKLYNKLIENRTFHTVIGYAFLKDLQDIILNSGIAKAEDLDGIYIPDQINTETNTKALENYKFLSEKQKVRIRNSKIVNFFLVFTILAMILIAIYTDKTMYAEFENKIVDRYSAWEADLNSREEDLIAREEALEQ